MSRPSDRLDDDALEGHLRRRAAMAHLSPADRERIIAAAGAAQSVRPTGMRWNIFSAPIAAALVVAVVVGVAVVGSLPLGPSAPADQTAPPVSLSSVTPPVSAAPRLEGLRALSAGEV